MQRLSPESVDASGRSAAASTTLAEPARHLTVEPRLLYGPSWSRSKHEKRPHTERGARRDRPAGERSPRPAAATTARAPAPGLRASGVAEPERPVGLPFRRGRSGAGSKMGAGQGRLPARDHGALPVGIRALRCTRPREDRLVRPHDRDPVGVAGPARLPGDRRGRLAHHRLARRAEARRAPGRLYAVRVRADGARASGYEAAADRPGRRRGPRLQARGQAGLRQRARHLADAVSRGARRRGPRRAALHARHRREEGGRRGSPARSRRRRS